MAKFLRDEFLKNITFDGRCLDQINSFLIQRLLDFNKEVKAREGNDTEVMIPTYIIRFDNRGYKLNEFSEVKKYFDLASSVERIIFTFDTALSEKSNRMYGTHYEVRLDANDGNNSNIQVASDDSDAVDAVFNGIMDIVSKGGNKNGYIRNTWSRILVQVLGVAIGFFISLIAALKISPYVKIENSFVITFLFAFIMFSNAWGFINQQLLRFLDYSFPNIRFVQSGKSSLHWLIQAIVGGVVVALTLYFISSSLGWVGRVLGPHIGG